MSESSFFEQAQSRVGGLVSVRGESYSSLVGKIGLLTGVRQPIPNWRNDAALFDLLVNGTLRTLYVYSYEIEFLDSRGDR